MTKFTGNTHFQSLRSTRRSQEGQKRLLTGNDYKVSEAWINKVIEGSRLRPDSGETIQNLVDDQIL